MGIAETFSGIAEVYCSVSFVVFALYGHWLCVLLTFRLRCTEWRLSRCGAERSEKAGRGRFLIAREQPHTAPLLQLLLLLLLLLLSLLLLVISIIIIIIITIVILLLLLS